MVELVLISCGVCTLNPQILNRKCHSFVLEGEDGRDGGILLLMNSASFPFRRRGDQI